jgi:hypothetical protein
LYLHAQKPPWVQTLYYLSPHAQKLSDHQYSHSQLLLQVPLYAALSA